MPWYRRMAWYFLHITLVLVMGRLQPAVFIQSVGRTESSGCAGVLSFEDMTKLLQEQVYILNTHLEGQGEHPVFRLESLTQQVYVTHPFQL